MSTNPVTGLFWAPREGPAALCARASCRVRLVVRGRRRERLRDNTDLWQDLGMAWHVAQVNIGRLRAPVDDPLVADFVAGLDRINALADGAPGFVWRLQTEDGNATAIRPVDDD